MLLCAIVTLYLLAREMGDFSGLQASISQTTFDFEGFRNNDNHFVKQFLGGALLAFCMTGLDQDMMQKNLTCKNSKSGQKNIITLSLLLIPINLLFLGLGYYLSTFAQEANLLVERPDHLFPTVIFSSGTFSAALGGLFVLGLIAAALSSADSALTSLTTCFQVDILQDKISHLKKIIDSRQLCLTPCCHYFRLLLCTQRRKHYQSNLYSCPIHLWSLTWLVSVCHECETKGKINLHSHIMYAQLLDLRFGVNYCSQNT